MIATAGVRSEASVRAERSHLAYILPVAILARFLTGLVLFRFRPAPPLTQWGYENIAVALSIHGGHGYASPFFIHSGPTALLAPGYPLLIAAVTGLLGTGSIASTTVVAFQIVLSLVTIAVVMFAAKSHFGVRTANLAGFICAICVPIFFQSLLIWDTTLCALLLVSGIAIAPRVSWSRPQSVAVGMGVAFAVLVNPSLLPALVAVFGWSAWRQRRAPWLAGLVFLIAFSPWPVRNAVVLHSFVPFRSNFGYELWAGNHPGTNGEFSKYDTPIYNSADLQEYVSKGEVAYMREKRALATAYITAYPREFVRSSALRFLRFWTGTSISAASPAAPSLAVLGWIGLALLWRRRAVFTLFALPLCLYPVLYYVTHADSRFLSVLGPVLAILAAHACESLLKFLKPELPAKLSAMHSAEVTRERTLVG